MNVAFHIPIAVCWLMGGIAGLLVGFMLVIAVLTFFNGDRWPGR